MPDFDFEPDTTDDAPIGDTRDPDREYDGRVDEEHFDHDARW